MSILEKSNRPELIRTLVNELVDRFDSNTLWTDIKEYIYKINPKLTDYEAGRITDNVYNGVWNGIKDILTNRHRSKQSQTYDLNNNVENIIQGINHSVKWDEGFVDDLLNDHSKMSKFIRRGIIDWYEDFLLSNNLHTFKLDENVLNNFIKINIDRIYAEFIQHLRLTKDRIIKQREDAKNKKIAEHKYKLREAHDEVNRLLELKTKKSKTQFYDNNVFNELDIHPEDMAKLWKEYNERWIPANERGKLQPRRPRPTIAYDDTFEDKLIKYLKTHPDEKRPISFDDFQKLTSGWPSSLTSIEDWYQYYIEHHLSNIAPEKIQVNSIGFKSPKKIKALKALFPNIESPDTSTKSYFPLKQNKKLYQLHKVCPKKTYIIDIMFCDKYAYLIAINVNTRFLYAAPMNKVVSVTSDQDNQAYMSYSKDADTYINALDSLIKSGMDVRYLQGDGEKAFDSWNAWAYYDSHDIEFKPVPRMKMGVYPDFMKKEQKQSKTDPMHGSLGILDRVIRTLRDMAYHIEVGIITPNIMKELVNQYNNVPHTTLSKYVGFDVTPQMVQDDEELENYIIRQIMKENEKVTSRAGFKLENGTPVKLYNEKDSMAKRRSIIQPGKYHIVDYHGGYYEVEDENKNRQFIPRFKLAIDI
mgnify:CR=1 FL=1